MIPECPHCESDNKELNQEFKCKKRAQVRARISGKKSFLVVRFGYYRRKKEARRISKFKCNECKKYFSLSTFEEEYYQKRRDINNPLRELLVSGCSQADASRFLKVNPKTVASRFLFLSRQAKLRQECWIKDKSQKKIETIYFDEMETFEHTKCKPLSIPLAVEEKTRKILSFGVARFAAKGHLANVARKKYGYRRNERPEVFKEFFTRIKPLINENTELISDQNPYYPQAIRENLNEKIKHKTYKGRAACVTGQGELKKGGFDPLFDLNHTCAMLRAHINRLFRRTWCTTKKPENLAAHIWLYVDHHNMKLTA